MGRPRSKVDGSVLRGGLDGSVLGAGARCPQAGQNSSGVPLHDKRRMVLGRRQRAVWLMLTGSFLRGRGDRGDAGSYNYVFAFLTRNNWKCVTLVTLCR